VCVKEGLSSVVKPATTLFYNQPRWMFLGSNVFQEELACRGLRACKSFGRVQVVLAVVSLDPRVGSQAPLQVNKDSYAGK
jgi:hypothetical protein